MVIFNKTKQTVVCTEGRLADTFLTRLLGLLGRKEMNAGEGLLIKPSAGVHTFGMSFAIDIVALDGEYRVLGVWSNIGPWRIRAVSRRTRCVLELPAGQIKRSQLAVGDDVTLVENHSGQLLRSKEQPPQGSCYEL